ncbi:MAG: CCA tRNA nucleotidyltransferase [Chloroflexi bacterium]|nr:CCA tRNA nucleotidyltransferase [Chloroflexota bacterium]
MDELIERCRAFFAARHAQAYLVGGTVRDEALGRSRHDIDFAVNNGALALARGLADHLGGAYYPLDAEREAGRVILRGGSIIDVTLLRGDSIEADLAARDFTINAMARGIGVDSTLIDPHGGLTDLRTRVVRAVSDTSFTQDAARVLRALRIAATLGFEIDPHTRALLLTARPLLRDVSRERLRDEVVRILALPRSGDTLRAMADAGLVEHLLPAWTINDDALARLGQLETYYARLGDRADAESILKTELDQTLSSERPRLIVTKAALFFADARAAARDLAALRFAAHEVSYAGALVRHARKLSAMTVDVSRLDCHRFFRDTGPAALTLLAIALSDERARQRWPVALQFVTWYRDEHARVISPRPLINGAELSSRFGLVGPAIGAMLVRLVEAQVAGQVSNADEAAVYVESVLRAGR